MPALLFTGLSPPCTGDKVELKADYRHEMTLADHRERLAFPKDFEGLRRSVRISADLYDTELYDWLRAETTVTTQDNTLRTEVLWINAHAAAGLRNEGKLGERKRDLFS